MIAGIGSALGMVPGSASTLDRNAVEFGLPT
jgi:hypothetical protein